SAARAAVVLPQDRLRLLLLPLGTRHLSALPLRPAHAAGLEGVSALLAVLAGADGRLSHGHGPAAPLGRGRSRIRTGCMAFLDRGARSLLLTELISGLVLTLKYMFR